MLSFPQCLALPQVFTFKWSVNWQFLPEPTFLSRQLALALLFLHLRLLWSLAQRSWCAARPCRIRGAMQSSAALPQRSSGMFRLRAVVFKRTQSVQPC